VFVVGLGLAFAGSCVALGIVESFPDPLPVILLGALFVLAVATTTETSVGAEQSVGVMLVLAAMVVYRPEHSYLGPALVGACGGLFIPHFRQREFRKLVFNTSMSGMAALAATAVFYGVASALGAGWVALLVAAIPAAFVDQLVNLLLLSCVLSLHRIAPLRESLTQLLRMTPQGLPFALLGVLLGQLYVDFGAVTVPFFVVPIFVARQTFASYIALKESHDATLRILIGALEAKDPYTAGHAERVATYADYIGIELGISASRLERLRLAALMHDVGKLIVPNHLLNKPGKLTAQEFSSVRRHEQASVEILTRIDFLAPVAPSATTEATRFKPVSDDHGQPIEPHIVAVADAFDAMTSTRSYRRALSQEVAFEELRRNAGKQFHPRVVDALIAALRRRGEVHGRGHETEVIHENAPEGTTGSAGLGDLVPESFGGMALP
jgi:hypothetical protein